jgi:hypothetical protein
MASDNPSPYSEARENLTLTAVTRPVAARFRAQRRLE